LLAGVEEIAGGSMEADGEKLRNMGSEAHAARLCEEVVAQGFPAPRRRL
jgi:predicted ABC-type transport system involved in lysophospholipase L1 biosynthesis ATPase subunit